jgi:hypothetical protein
MSVVPHMLWIFDRPAPILAALKRDVCDTIQHVM